MQGMGRVFCPNALVRREKMACFYGVIERAFPKNVDFMWEKCKKIMHKVGKSGRMWLLNPERW